VELADVDEAFFASAGKLAAHRERREKAERPEPVETGALPVELPAAEAPSQAPAQTEQEEAASIAPVSPAEPAAAAPAESGEDLEARRRGRRDERPTRVTSPAEQAWGQPIGTPRLAPTPAPVVVEDTRASTPEPDATGATKQDHPADTETE